MAAELVAWCLTRQKKKKKMNKLHAQKIGRPFKLVTINVKGYPQAQD
jgi:hypothetical protein